MRDLLPLLLEEPPPQAGTYPQPLPPPPDAEPLAHSGSGKSRGGSLVAKLRRRWSSGDGEASSSGGGSWAPGGVSVDADAAFSPLARGQNGAAGLQQASLPEARAPEHPSRFMDRVRALRGRGTGSSRDSRGSEGEAGPLAQGLGQQQPQQQEAQRQQAPVAEDAMETFLKSVSEAKALLAEVVQRQRHIEGKRAALRSMAVPAEIAAAQEQVREEVEEVTLACKRVKQALQRLDALSAGLLAEDQEGAPQAEQHAGLQMRLSLLAGLHAKCADVTRRWQRAQAAWLEQDREEVARQLHTVTGRDVPPDAVDEAICSGQAEGLYRQALSNTHGEAVRQMVSDVRKRHDQVRALEASMAELHQVFLDMSLLVQDQGDMLDRIDMWVGNAGAAMQESVRSLRQAARSRRSAAQTKAVTFVTGVGMIAGGAGLTATGVGAVAGIPMIVAGAAAVGGSALGGVT